MKKKIVAVCLSVGLISFSALAIHQSGSATMQQPDVASYQEGHLVATSTDAAPQAFVAAAARVVTAAATKAYVYATNAYKANSVATSEVTRNASFWALGTETVDSEEVEDLEIIFDR